MDFINKCNFPVIFLLTVELWIFVIEVSASCHSVPGMVSGRVVVATTCCCCSMRYWYCFSTCYCCKTQITVGTPVDP